MAPAPARFINPIPNAARYKKYNAVTLDVLCDAAYRGDMAKLEVLLRSGAEDEVFNGDAPQMKSGNTF